MTEATGTMSDGPTRFIQNLLNGINTDSVTNIAVWIMVSAVVVFVVLQIVITVRTLLLIKRTSVLRTEKLRSLIPDKGLNKAGLSHELENWFRDHFLISWENDQFIGLSRRHNRYLVRDIRGMLPSLKNSPMSQAPSLLTTMGILGTFVGISMGLTNFDPSHLGVDTSALMNASVDMLKGMKTAFYTSLVGMSASVLLVVLGLIVARHLEQWYADKATKAFQAVCMEALPIDYLVSLDPELQKRSLDAQLANSEMMGTALAEFRYVGETIAKSLGDFSTSAIVQGVSAAFQRAVESELKPIFGEISRELGLLREIKQDTGQELVRMITQSIHQDVVAPLGKEIEKTCNTVNRANETTSALAGKLDEVMGGFGEAIETISTFQNETMNKLSDFSASLREVLSDFRDDTTQVLKRVSSEVSDAIGSSIEGMKMQRQAFLESSREVADTLSGLGTTAGQMMTKAREELETGLGDIDRKVLSMSQTVQKELESFRVEYQVRLNEFFTGQNELIGEALSQQKDTLEGVITDYRKTFEEDHQRRVEMFSLLSDSHAQLQESAQVVQELVEHIGVLDRLTTDNLQSVAREIGRQAGLLGKHYKEASENFANMTDLLPRAMGDYFERANKSFEGFFHDFDRAAGSIHQKLAEAANYLVVAAVEQKRLKIGEAVR